MDAKIISFANFKGGVGKTSTTALVGYNLATRLGKKVLLIDFDSQANLTDLCMKTATQNSEEDIVVIEKTLMHSIAKEVPIKEIILPIRENLDLIPNAVDFSVYTRFLSKNISNEIDQVTFFKNLIEPLRAEYDYIFIDVPPTPSLLNDTAFIACDYIIVVLQTQARSLEGANVFIEYLINQVNEEYDANVKVLGVLPVLTKSGTAVDSQILDKARDLWGEEYIFENIINLMERVKRVDLSGITDNESDIHDKRMHEKYTAVAAEVLSRIENM